jgi:hypothetical protein
MRSARALSPARFLQSLYAANSGAHLVRASSPNLQEQFSDRLRMASQSSSVPSLEECLMPPSEPESFNDDETLPDDAVGRDAIVFEGTLSLSLSPRPRPPSLKGVCFFFVVEEKRRKKEETRD